MITSGTWRTCRAKVSLILEDPVPREVKEKPR